MLSCLCRDKVASMLMSWTTIFRTQPLAKKFVTAMIELLKSGNIILVKITVRILRDDDMLERLKWKVSDEDYLHVLECMIVQKE